MNEFGTSADMFDADGKIIPDGKIDPDGEGDHKEVGEGQKKSIEDKKKD